MVKKTKRKKKVEQPSVPEVPSIPLPQNTAPEPTPTIKSPKVAEIKNIALQSALDGLFRTLEQSGGSQVKIIDVVQEFLENFMIIGYDYNHKPLVVMYNQNSKDSDALATLLQKFLITTRQAVLPPES